MKTQPTARLRKLFQERLVIENECQFRERPPEIMAKLYDKQSRLYAEYLDELRKIDDMILGRKPPKRTYIQRLERRRRLGI